MDRGIAVLLDCLKRDEDEAKLSRLQSYNSEDWKAACTAAAQYRLAPLLYHTLKPYSGNLPGAETAYKELRKAYMTTAALNIKHYRQLLDLVEIFKAEKIPLILLKGSHLVELVYGNLALRPMSDMDLLVKAEDLGRVDAVMKREGYSAPGDKHGYSFEHLPPYSKHGAVMIEIHYHIVEPPYSKRFEVNELWERAQRETIEDVEVLTFSPEDLVLHICYHAGIHHAFNTGLVPFLDIDRIASYYSNGLDWELCRRRAEEWGMERALYLVLALTNKITGMQIPSSMVEQMPSSNELEEVILNTEEIIFDQSKGSSSKFIARLFSDEPVKEKLALIKTRLLPDREYMFLPDQVGNAGNPGLINVVRIYLSRFRGLITRHAKFVWLGLRRDPQTVAAMREESKRNRLREWLGKR